MSQKITSARNPRFLHWARILRRRKLPDGTPILPITGPKLLQEALSGGWEPVMVARLTEEAYATENPPVEASETENLLFSESLFAKLTDTESPQEPLAIMRQPFSPTTQHAWHQHRRVIIADAIQDPGNLGALIRSARAFGFTCLITTEGSASPASLKVLRASAGSLFHLRLVPSQNPTTLSNQLKKHGFLTVTLDPTAPTSLEAAQWREPLAILVGNEAHGPSSVWRVQSAHDLLPVKINMATGMDSLNAVMAATIALYTASQKLSDAL